MAYRITRKETAKQFIIAIQLLLEWIEKKEISIEKPISTNILVPSCLKQNTSIYRYPS